jgi:formate/nitrite transporter FocA (FNT family)
LNEIDHDPKEPAHRSWKIMAVVAGVITIGIMIVLGYGVRHVLESLPIYVPALIVGLAFGLGIGFRIGWWDCERYYSRTKGKDG